MFGFRISVTWCSVHLCVWLISLKLSTRFIRIVSNYRFPSFEASTLCTDCIVFHCVCGVVYVCCLLHTHVYVSHIFFFLFFVSHIFFAHSSTNGHRQISHLDQAFPFHLRGEGVSYRQHVSEYCYS